MAELRFLVQLIAQHGRALPRLVADLRRRATAHPVAAERVLSTAHKAKGLEWSRVRLAPDFPSLEELHLLYVAATRARQQLEPNVAVRSCLAGWATVQPGGTG